MTKIFLTIFTVSLLFISLCSGNSYADVSPARNAKLKSIDWRTTPELKRRFNSYFDDLLGKPWDALSFKLKIDQINRELFTSGYFSSSIKMSLEGTETNIIVKVSIEAKERINFQFQGNKIFTHQELRSKLVDKIKNDFGKLDRNGLSNFINETYEDSGYYNNTIKSYENAGRDLEGISVKTYFFVIEEGEKLKVSNIIYRGNVIFKGDDLEHLFKKSGSSLALAGYYDKAFFENFTNIIKKEYLAHGFVFAEVSKPRVVTSDEDESLTIEYGISEKQQVLLKNITLNNIDPEAQKTVKALLTNKEGTPVNVVELENDLKAIIQHFQSQGYYFASISNLNSDSLLVYDKSYSSVEFRPDMILDRQICYNDPIINGNNKTKTEVITREINLSKGEMITPAKLENFRQKLSNLGLFSTLKITPYMVYEGDEKTCAKTNLIIQVKEKDFNQWEVAPGYRTDLGYKVSAGITWGNLMGMNRTLSFKTQANLRTNLDGFDIGRQTENRHLLEHLEKISYTEPYVFNYPVEFEGSASAQRKRFSGFDADIYRIAPQFTKVFNLNDFNKDNIALAVRYQFEHIRQFDATLASNNDNFTIGSITPSITLDKRNDPIYTRKGYYLNLSSEWANHYFGSMNQSDLEINYIKIISRNKFYYPLGDFILAFSVALGYEKNFSTDILKDANGKPLLNVNGAPRTHGYIPSIKVFRLDGYDEIRGYSEDEINRLSNGIQVDDTVVQNEAYFTAFKFEPRYNLTDSIQLGVFFDAGRVSVNEFKPFSLRSSVGAGVKFLTPVGSLDFDYGVKLQRKTYPDNVHDSFGRFHLSIGYF